MTLAPGIYRATVRGVLDQIVMLTDNDTEDPWVSLIAQRGGPSSRWFLHSMVTDARPLIVLDLDDFAAVTTPATGVVQALRQAVTAFARQQAVERNILTYLADQIEAQSRPPRIEEPGLWGVVEANLEYRTLRRKFVRLDSPTQSVWIWIDADGSSSGRWSWDNLLDPALIRPGIEATT